MNLDKLKESARKFEQGSQWRQAIDVYKQALKEFEERGEGVLDPSLYNRIGDLEIKDGDSGAAIRAYEQAADLYTEQGFFNNAIALCSKILRINSGRSPTYLRLAQLNARKNFIGEAKRNLVEYIERMEALSHREDAFKAIEVFANQFASNPEIRLMLVELLRSSSRENEARRQLERLADDLDAAGDASGAQETRDRIAAMTDGAAPTAPPPAPRPPRSSHSGLVFLDVGVPTAVPGQGAAVDGLDIERDPEAVTEEWRTDTDDLEDGIIPALSVDSADDRVPDLLKDDPLDEGEVMLADSESGPVDIDAYPVVQRGARPAPGTSADLVFLPVSGRGTDSDDTDAIDDVAVFSRDRARVLFEIGDRAGGVAALEEAVRQFEGTNRFEEAIQAVDDLVRVEPDAIYRYQKRVELAYRLGDRAAMLQSYLGLADALLRGGGLEHAVTVYRRILEHDPENAQAKAALNMLAPPPPLPEASSFVDLGALILETPQNRDTRMRIDQQAPIEDEDEAFHEALAQFKRGIDENIDAEDFQAHYDLGIAFKEMGLLDEAIAQFQKALRAPEGRLKTSEQLGIAFFDKSRFAIAEAVLRRAAESLPGGDEEKIGLIYWLARALEAQRRFEESLKYYERVLAVDIRFLDVGERVHRLTSGAS
ncbi:MAG: tetratricopeptide repeat protein [Gemmatimonadetes bacterium]|nr:tetratricopeptide repeat protein [Gemmatimonadota bacterium]